MLMLFITIAVYAPEAERDTDDRFESWLRSTELTSFSLKLAIDFNSITSPEIVFAQACLETGYFSSKLCIEHNNLFGMKKARKRATTAQGSANYNYAIYSTWYDSVKDIKLFQEYYLSRGRDLTDYFGFLASIGYAEDPLYLTKLGKICTL